MGLRINTNVASIRAQNALLKSTKKLNSAMTRLSTGLRINTGSDDVVGLAKSESLRTRIRGIEQARANIASSSSVLGVAEGYLSELTELAQSLREVAVQAADDTISASDRSSLTDKFTSLMAEYNRLADNSNFNGVKLLDGTFVNKNVQVGTDEGDAISISVSDARSATIGTVALFTSQTRTAVLTTTTTTNLAFGDPAGITIGTTAISTFASDGVSTVEASESALAYVNAINAQAGTTGVTAKVLANSQTFTYTGTQALSAAYNLVVNGVTVKTDATAYAADDDGVASVVALINAKTSLTGVVATQDTANDKLVLTASDGRNISVTVTGADTTVSTNVFAMTGSSSNRASIFRGTFRLTSDSAFTIAGASAEFAASASVSVALDAGFSLDNALVTTAANAGSALTILDNVIKQLQTRRATIGSAINRFETSESELASRLENLSAADSKIREADVAMETAKMTQANILQQAGVAVLGQANSAPQIALQLLQNL